MAGRGSLVEEQRADERRFARVPVKREFRLRSTERLSAASSIRFRYKRFAE
jgi:hypothetical protein